MMFTPHVSLIGAHVRLEPLSLAHAEGLLPHALEPEIWLYIPYGNINTLEKLQNMISGLLRKQETGSDLCYTVFHQASNQPIGMTRYISVDRSNYGVEIGGTWYGKDYRRSAVNTEAKYLLLRHAFEVFACQRVQIQSDVRNERSQRAIERLGAVREGIMRKNKRMPDGHQRNSIMYSIIDNEWPAIKAKLEGWLQKSQL
ncbi:MAG: GNAT family N-acetyltransferase [Chloroflexi bacterium]|nr:GNAT family N-acetyltransferase [Chloroflexota bacterium]